MKSELKIDVTSGWNDIESPHGGVLRFPGPYPRKDPEADSQAMVDFLKKGLETLRNGTSRFCSDVEPDPAADVQLFEMFDIETGEYIFAWRVACRETETTGN